MKTSEVTLNELTCQSKVNSSLGEESKAQPNTSKLNNKKTLIETFIELLKEESPKKSANSAYYWTDFPTLSGVCVDEDFLDKNERIRELSGQVHIKHKNDSVSEDNKRESNFTQCFPLFRKHVKHSVNKKTFPYLSRPKLYSAFAISPSCTRFVLVENKQWFCYQIFNNINDSPKLEFSGKTTQQQTFSTTRLANNSSALTDAPSDETFSATNTGTSTFSSDIKNFSNFSWDYIMAEMSEHYIILAGTLGMIRIIDLQNNCDLIYAYTAPAPIRCIAISPDESIAAFAYTLHNPKTDVESSIISIVGLLRSKPLNTPISVSPISRRDSGFATLLSTNPIPYHDPINSLSFSRDGAFLMCSTIMESRFMMLSVYNPHKPYIVLTSYRNLDKATEGEGITSLRLFPGSRLLLITSRAYDAPPLIMDLFQNPAKKGGLFGRPYLICRVNEVGNEVYSSAVSPRCDAIAFSTRAGNVYLMYAAKINEEFYQIVQTGKAMNANTALEGAVLQFSPNGQKLYTLDRRGSLQIDDFAAGLENEEGITACRIIK